MDDTVAYQVQCGQALVPLGDSLLTVGRSAVCEIVLDSRAVSRKHARIGLRDGKPFVADLSSANGVFVNGRRIVGECVLELGDLVVIGNEELRLSAQLSPTQDAARLAQTQGMGTRAVDTWLGDSGGFDENEPDTKQHDGVALMTSVANRFLEAGSPLKAGELIGPKLEQLLQEARGPQKPDRELSMQVAQSALDLAVQLSDPKWVGYVIELYDALGVMIPEPVIDKLHAAVRKLPRIRVDLLRRYMERMRRLDLSPNHRFLLRRLEGVERVAATR